MHAQKYDRWTATEADLEHLEDVREKVKDVDLTTPEGADYADQLLREYDLPHFLVFGLKSQPKELPPEVIARLEQIVTERRDNGALS
jgi:hypothetical protein